MNPMDHDEHGDRTGHGRHAGHDHEHHVGHDGSHAGHAATSAPDASHDAHAGTDHTGHDMTTMTATEHSAHAGHADPDDHSAHAGGHEDHSAHGGHDGHSGHGGHAGHVAMFRRLFWIMLALAVPTVGASMMFASIIGYPLPDVPGIAWISPILGTVMYVWGGKPFLTGAVDELKARKPGMMLLVALAITVAFVSSWGASLGILSHELDFWWELALLVVIMLLGHWIEMRSLAQSSSALESLAALLPDEAERVGADGQVTTVSPDRTGRGRRRRGASWWARARGRRGVPGVGGRRRVDDHGRVAPGAPDGRRPRRGRDGRDRPGVARHGRRRR